MFKADSIFMNGNVITMNDKQPRANAVAVWQDKIIAVGSNDAVEDLKGENTKIYDLEGSTMIPGLNDNHSHIIHYGQNLLNVDCTPEVCPDIASLKAAIAKRASEVEAGEWIGGWGYDECRMTEKRHPTKEDLDEAAPNNPVFITRACVHMSVANSMALTLGNITNDTKDPQGGHIVRNEKGEPSGLLQDNAQNAVKSAMPRIGKEQLIKFIEMSSKAYNSLGITSTCDASTLFEIDDEMSAWHEARKTGKLSVRVYTLMAANNAANVCTLGVGGGFGDNMLKVGAIKFFTDGSVSGATSAMSEGFDSSPENKGILYMSQEELEQKVMDAHKAGYQVSVHAIGDRAIESVLNAFEKANKAYPRENHRHRIEHCQVCPTHLQERVKKLGLTAIMQPGFLYFFGAAHIKHLGRERLAYEFPMKSMLDRGVVTTLSTDNPVVNPGPAYTLYAALTRNTVDGDNCGKEEVITAEQALWAYTLGGAYTTFEEDIKGSIEVGKLADLAVLNLDPTKVDVEEILNMKALMTVLGGKVVFEA